MMSACFSNVGLRGEREREVIQLKSFKELDVIFIGPALSGLGNGVRLPHLLNFHQYLELSCSPPSITTIGRPNSWVVAIESLLVVTAEIESVGDDKYKGRMRRDATGIQGPDISNVEESEEGLESREGKEPIEGHASSSPETAVATGIQRPDISNMEELEEGLESGIYRKASRKMSDRRGIGTCREGKEPIEGHASSSPETAVATGIQGPDISNVEEPEEGLESGCDGQLRVEPYIPEVLLVEIFSRLPEGAQLRLQAVCKSWCRLIPTVQPRGGTVYHLPTGDLLNDLASFMMPGETVKAAILRLGREKRGPMSFAILKENMKALRQTNLFKQRVDRLVSRGFKDIEEWTKEDVLEASKKWSSTCKSV